MTLYSAGMRTSATSSAALEVLATGSERPKLLEVGLFLATAVASVYGIGRPSVKSAGGSSQAATIALAAEDPADEANGAASQTLMASSWATTAPGLPAKFFRRIGLPATVGTGVIWTFPRGITIPSSSGAGAFPSVTIHATSAAVGVLDAYCVVDE